MYQNEIITLLLGVGVWGLILLKLSAFRQIPRFRLLAVAYLLLTFAWMATNAEAVGWPGAFNLVEHVCYFASSVVIAFWCWATLCSHGGDRR